MQVRLRVGQLAKLHTAAFKPTIAVGLARNPMQGGLGLRMIRRVPTHIQRLPSGCK